MRSRRKMKWSKLSINNIPPEISEELGALLMDCGASGIEERFHLCGEISPLDHSPRHDEYAKPNTSGKVILDAYFRKLDQSSIRRIIANIKSTQSFTFPFGDLQVHIEEIDDKDWNEEWKKGFNPLRVGKNLVISPSWKNKKYGRDKTVIFLDPGMAFGTGHHPTTAFCLKYLGRAIKKHKTRHMLDVGTGSGILAIVAARLGAKSIIAIDIDESALEVARQNSVVNNVSKKIIFSDKPLKAITGRFDLIVANILLQTILEYSATFANLLSPRGQCVISGILRNQRKDIMKEFVNKNSFKLILEEKSGEWASFVFGKE